MTNRSESNNLTRDREALFRQIRLFSGLSDKELNSLEKGKEEWYEKGNKIIAEGETHSFYVVLEGKVQIILKEAQRSSAFYV